MHTSISALKLCILSSFVTLAGCLELQTTDKSVGEGPGGGEPIPARPLFNALEPELLGLCGPCHQSPSGGNSPFLEGDTVDARYTRITSWPGIIVPEAPTSALLTFPGSASHTQWQAPDLTADLKPKVQSWLEAEATNLSEDKIAGWPRVTPFSPLVGDAFNSITLASVGDAFKPVSISFNASELGGSPDAPTMLRLTKITVHTVADKPVHLAHPVFYVQTADGAPELDPVDSFADLDQTFTSIDDTTLGTGELFLTNWHKGANLGIAFEVIEIPM